MLITKEELIELSKRKRELKLAMIYSKNKSFFDSVDVLLRDRCEFNSAFIPNEDLKTVNKSDISLYLSEYGYDIKEIKNGLWIRW